MAQRPSFDMTKMTTADKILGGASLLLFIDSFLPWQRACTPNIGGFRFCASFSAWGGSGGWAGAIMAILALVLLLAVAATVMGVALPPTMPMRTVLTALAGGTVVFGIIKFLIVIGKSGSFGAWVGLILLLAIAYGAWMKWQEAATALPPATGTGTGYTP